LARRFGNAIPIALSLLILVAAAATPFVLQSHSAPAWAQAARRASPVELVNPGPSLRPVVLSGVATPIQPGDPPATQPQLDSIREAGLVAAEDLRLRTLLHHIGRLTYPTVVPPSQQYDAANGVMRAGTPTLVLPGPATYSLSDLQAAGAVLPLAQTGFLLVDGVLVANGATLNLGGPDLPRLLMDSSNQGFTSLVTWGGTISLAGEGASSPLIVSGWDRTSGEAAADRGYGRPYIRAVGGRLDLSYTYVSNLGFWSGRTGGVAWTGISSKASTGSAVSSRFIGDTYGAFISRSTNVQFTDDLFESNELDGLRLHRSALNSTVTASAAVRNGGNGFVVSRGATGNHLRGDLAVNNRGNGFFIDGLPLVSGASPSGENAAASVGTDLRESEAEANGRTGILVEGGSGTIVMGNIVSATVTGIAVRGGASNTMIVGNEVTAGGRVALSIGPAVTGTTIEGNTLNDARIGILVRNSPGVRIMNNHITGITVFGISVRGVSPGVVGNDNVIAGRGFQPVDTRGGADAPTFKSTDTSGWQHRSSLSVIASLRYHPLLATWLVILLFVLISAVVVRLRRRPARPYYYTVPWRPTTQYSNGSAHAESPATLSDTAIVAAAAQSSPRVADAERQVLPARRRPRRRAVTLVGEEEKTG
jgi:hypothetical protein